MIKGEDKMNLIYFSDCHLAINEAMRQERMCVGYKKPFGWVIYSPKTGAPKDIEPEILCLSKNMLPIPLSDNGMEIVMSWVEKIIKETQLILKINKG
jgi:hypothetical protein